MSKLNQKLLSIRFVYKFDRKLLDVVHTLLYIDKKSKLQTTLFQKRSARENFLKAKLEHRYSLKKVFPTAKQALQI